MLRVLSAYLHGDRQVCSMVRVPTPDEEDAKRMHREREHLVQEKLRIENRIEALLFTQGIRKRPSLRSWERDLAALRTGDGRELPPICGRARSPTSPARADLGVDPRGRSRARPAAKPNRKMSQPQDRCPLPHPRYRRELRRRAHARGVLSLLRQSPAARQLCRHHADALPERRYGPRPADQPRREPACADDDDPACLALAALPARQRTRRVVPRARRRAWPGAPGGSPSSRWRASC